MPETARVAAFGCIEATLGNVLDVFGLSVHRTIVSK